MTTRLVSLAAGVHPDLAPEDMVNVAAAAGWPACGVWFDASTWTPARTREVRSRLDDTGLVALDLEPIIPAPDTEDHGEFLLDTAAEIGARFALFTSRLGDLTATAQRFATLHSRARDLGVVLVCEFLPIFPLATLSDAWAVVRDLPRGSAGILVDNLHLSRSGGLVADIEDLHARYPGVFPYLQIADAPLHAPTDRAGLYDEAVNGRLLPGDGALDIAGLCRAVPEVALSFEVRSAPLRAIGDPVDRARQVLAAAHTLI